MAIFLMYLLIGRGVDIFAASLFLWEEVV